MYASAWAAVNVAPARYWTSPAVPNGMVRNGKPRYIRSDNGSEFKAGVLQAWLRTIEVEPIYIYPGSPWENGYNERFNGTLRHEVLDTEVFY